MGKKQKILRAASFMVSAFLILGVLLLAVAAFMLSQNKVPRVFGYSLLHIVSGSMEPELPAGCYILVRETPAEELEEGDVISFYSTDETIYMLPNTHRIQEIRHTEDGLAFTTKGDANGAADSAEVTPDRLIGRVVGQVGILNVVGGWLRRPLVFLLVIIVPLSGIMVWEMIDIAKARSAAKEEDGGEEKKDG